MFKHKFYAIVREIAKVPDLGVKSITTLYRKKYNSSSTVLHAPIIYFICYYNPVKMSFIAPFDKQGCQGGQFTRAATLPHLHLHISGAKLLKTSLPNDYRAFQPITIAALPAHHFQNDVMVAQLLTKGTPFMLHAFASVCLIIRNSQNAKALANGLLLHAFASVR